ncbi:MAG: acylneuraminate cytidylyltransferase family protein [Lachnospiraceae bacterium]|nr:acylneuraminate cytidylyltransferase family protein [Lachnospiraceae bacterium]MCM1237849.1 acylneuraminate cytidylyltransferase family protein [Lachnospiraceae bacterium]
MIAIIPARGGSKGLPGKNIRELNGKPLIAYTIEAAQKARQVEKIIVSTDDHKIAEVAKEYGAEVPFLRPDELATDTSQAVDVYLHAVDYLMQESDKRIDKFMVLLPTAPLRTEIHINEAMELFERSGAETLISMKEAETPVTWYHKKLDNGRVQNAGFGEGDAIHNRQTNTVFYVPNGAIYILDYKLLKEKRTYYSNDTVAYIMSAQDSVDIDTLLDFDFAQYLMQLMGNEGIK